MRNNTLDSDPTQVAMQSGLDLQRRIEVHRESVLLAHRQLLEMLPPEVREEGSKLGVAALVGLVHKKRQAWKATSGRVVALEKRIAELEAGRSEAKARLVAKLPAHVRSALDVDAGVRA